MPARTFFLCKTAGSALFRKLIRNFLNTKALSLRSIPTRSFRGWLYWLHNRNYNQKIYFDEISYVLFYTSRQLILEYFCLIPEYVVLKEEWLVYRF